MQRQTSLTCVRTGSSNYTDKTQDRVSCLVHFRAACCSLNCWGTTNWNNPISEKRSFQIAAYITIQMQSQKQANVGIILHAQPCACNRSIWKWKIWKLLDRQTYFSPQWLWHLQFCCHSRNIQEVLKEVIHSQNWHCRLVSLFFVINIRCLFKACFASLSNLSAEFVCSFFKTYIQSRLTSQNVSMS